MVALKSVHAKSGCVSARGSDCHTRVQDEESTMSGGATASSSTCCAMCAAKSVCVSGTTSAASSATRPRASATRGHDLDEVEDDPGKDAQPREERPVEGQGLEPRSHERERIGDVVPRSARVA